MGHSEDKKATRDSIIDQAPWPDLARLRTVLGESRRRISARLSRSEAARVDDPADDSSVRALSAWGLCREAAQALRGTPPIKDDPYNLYAGPGYPKAPTHAGPSNGPTAGSG